MIAVLGDLHIGASSNSKDVWNHQQDFFVKEFLPFLVAHPEIQYVVQTGDFFDNRTAVHHTAMYHGRWICEQIGNLGRRMIILVGNHDIPYKNTTDYDSIWPILGQCEHVEIVHHPEAFANLDSLIVPWISPENSSAVVKAMTNTSQQYLFGHFDIIGGKFNKHGMESKHGLDVENLSQFKRVISGHYHTRSRIGNVDFVGTPYELDWNDWNDPKGWHTFDPGKNLLTFHESKLHLFHKIIHTDRLVEIIPPNPWNDFAGKIVKVESQLTNSDSIKKFVERIGDAVSIQVTINKPEEKITITDFENKSVVQVLLDAASNCSRPEGVSAIMTKALEKVKSL